MTASATPALGVDTERNVRVGAGLMSLAGLGFVGYGLIFFVMNFSEQFLELGITEGEVPVGRAEITEFSPQLFHYISHLHIAIAGMLIAIGIGVAALAWIGVRARGEPWAWWTAVSPARGDAGHRASRSLSEQPRHPRPPRAHLPRDRDLRGRGTPEPAGRSSATLTQRHASRWATRWSGPEGRDHGATVDGRRSHTAWGVAVDVGGRSGHGQPMAPPLGDPAADDDDPRSSEGARPRAWWLRGRPCRCGPDRQRGCGWDAGKVRRRWPRVHRQHRQHGLSVVNHVRMPAVGARHVRPGEEGPPRVAWDVYGGQMLVLVAFDLSHVRGSPADVAACSTDLPTLVEVAETGRHHGRRPSSYEVCEVWKLQPDRRPRRVARRVPGHVWLDAKGLQLVDVRSWAAASDPAGPAGTDPENP